MALWVVTIINDRSLLHAIVLKVYNSSLEARYSAFLDSSISGFAVLGQEVRVFDDWVIADWILAGLLTDLHCSIFSERLWRWSYINALFVRDLIRRLFRKHLESLKTTTIQEIEWITVLKYLGLHIQQNMCVLPLLPKGEGRCILRNVVIFKVPRYLRLLENRRWVKWKQGSDDL